jgi:hypothetical protein
MKICRKCNAIFYPSAYENCCSDCADTHEIAEIQNHLKEKNCYIVEAKGRCEKYYKNKCQICLNPTAHWNWIGWRKANVKEIKNALFVGKRVRIWKELPRS